MFIHKMRIACCGLVLACLGAAGNGHAAQVDDDTEPCGDVLERFFEAHQVSPATPPHQVALPMGAAYVWKDGVGTWVTVFLPTGWEVKRQAEWGHSFEVTGQCVQRGHVFNVWFAKYEPEGA